MAGFYWPILHPKIDSYVTPGDNFLLYHMYCVHSLPFFSSLINVLVSRVNFIPSHDIYYMISGACYSVANFLGTCYRGKPLYPFLDWTDYKSVLFCVILIIVCGIVY